MSPTLQTEAIVLIKHPPTEKHTPLTLLSPEHAILRAYQRQTTKTTAITLDHFDHAQLQLQTPHTPSADQQLWFINAPPQLLHRHSALGRNYETLHHAAIFAQTIAQNPPSLDDSPRLFHLLQKTLTALGTSTRPDIIHLKALYTLAKNEGYPLQQHWHPQLPPSLRTATPAILNTPADQQSPEKPLITDLLSNLTHYLKTQTDLLLPD